MFMIHATYFLWDTQETQAVWFIESTNASFMIQASSSLTD